MNENNTSAKAMLVFSRFKTILVVSVIMRGYIVEIGKLASWHYTIHI